MAVLGIDTSCYRTSVAIVEDGVVLKDVRRLLEVKSGERGLRQSEGLFQHVQNIGGIIKTAFEGFEGSLEAVSVSTRPRDVEGSYMPVFTVGEAVARSIASALSVPLYTTSHQQGHIRAALQGCDMPEGDFLSMHLSGGTTEMLRVSDYLDVALIGKTSDLNAGQLVDRIGVKMGLGFPSGSELEQLAGKGISRSLAPSAVNGLDISLSGAEARLSTLVESGSKHEDVASEVYSFLERTFCKWIENATRSTGIYNVLMAGGVSASDILRRALPARLEKRGCEAKLYWTSRALSGDNAVGVALIGEDLVCRGGYYPPASRADVESAPTIVLM